MIYSIIANQHSALSKEMSCLWGKKELFASFLFKHTILSTCHTTFLPPRKYVPIRERGLSCCFRVQSCQSRALTYRKAARWPPVGRGPEIRKSSRAELRGLWNPPPELKSKWILCQSMANFSKLAWFFFQFPLQQPYGAHCPVLYAPDFGKNSHSQIFPSS